MLSLNDGRKQLYQWDTGRTASVSIDCDIIHFSNLTYGEALAVQVKNGEVEIPNQLLTSGSPVHCWAFVLDENGAYTKQEQTIDVIKRGKPSDYVYTQTEVVTIQSAVENALEQAKESGAFKGDKGDDGYTPVKNVDYFDGKDGQNGFDGKDGNGIESAVLNDDYTLTLTFDDGTSYTTPNIRGATGNPGVDGVGIASVHQTTTSTEDDGNNVFTVTLTDGTSSTFTVQNGSKGNPGYTPQKGIDYFDGVNGKDGVSVTHSWSGTTLTITSASGTTSSDLKGDKGDPYTLTDTDKNAIADEVKNSLQSEGVVCKINDGISVIDTGLTYSRGVVEVRRIGSILWVVDSGVYNFTADFKQSNNRTILQLNLPKEISNKLHNVNGIYGGTGTIGYFPALAYENVTYTTFNCQSYLKRYAIGDEYDTFQLVYTGLSAISGGGMCGFHLKMPLFLIDAEEREI